MEGGEVDLYAAASSIWVGVAQVSGGGRCGGRVRGQRVGGGGRGGQGDMAATRTAAEREQSGAGAGRETTATAWVEPWKSAAAPRSR